jgi:hypothetical protein
MARVKRPHLPFVISASRRQRAESRQPCGNRAQGGIALSAPHPICCRRARYRSEVPRLGAPRVREECREWAGVRARPVPPPHRDFLSLCRPSRGRREEGGARLRQRSGMSPCSAGQRSSWSALFLVVRAARRRVRHSFVGQHRDRLREICGGRDARTRGNRAQFLDALGAA